ncbi:MAG: hypothetical protein JW829_04650 [Pirellulales bacterium]|nr:hypothetical protein [Pirellulales bacterium]
MKIQNFLKHHGIRTNPFADEDAQTDPVFKDYCIDETRHPAWDKVYGNPAEPATSIVFGEKGSGKTALRLQIVRKLAEYNRAHAGDRVYIIDYDDFNRFLDRFASKLSPRKQQNPTKVLAEWKLWDHMDAILSLGVTSLIDRILEVKLPSGPAGNLVGQAECKLLDSYQVRDLLILAACYDQSSEETFQSRWHRLRRKLKFRTWKRLWDRAVGLIVMIAVAAVIWRTGHWNWLGTWWPYAIVAAGWIPWLVRVWKWFWAARAIVKNVRVGTHEINSLRRVLMHFSANQINGQSLPNQRRTDDRYELLMKLQGVLKTLGYGGIIVLVDRVDEPHLINGKTEPMKVLVWSLLDNKFLKHTGLGIKLLLPIELADFLEKEDRDFYQRARLDKQNMVPSLEWTGEALYDVATARLRACSANGKEIVLRQLFDESVSDERLVHAFRDLRVPRHLFKFMYRLLVAHGNAHRDDDPVWTISGETFESVLAVYRRDQDAIDRGLRAG